MLVLAEIISSTLNMEAIYFSETSVATQQTTRRHIPEDDTLRHHRCENLKSYTKNCLVFDANLILYFYTPLSRREAETNKQTNSMEPSPS
jgi:hypothetical protein